MKSNRTLILNTLLIVIFYSCTPENPTPNPTPTTLSIGQSYQGGKIAYIDASGLHGLIAAPSDQGQAPWGCMGTAIAGADGTAIGTGSQNTIDIMNGCSELNKAASLCKNLDLNGYGDWYLPSLDELNQLYINRVAIGGFDGLYYWSSTESSSTLAWRIYSADGIQFVLSKYVNDCSVRAVRSF